MVQMVVGASRAEGLGIVGVYQDRLVKDLAAGDTRRVRMEWIGGHGEGTRVGGPLGPATLGIGSWCVVGEWCCCQCLARKVPFRPGPGWR